MGSFDFVIPIVLLLVMILAYQSLKIANENERFAVFMLGRFMAFKGPGLVFKTGAMKLVRLRVGDVGVVSGSEFVRFGESDVPVAQASEFRTGDSVRILSFGDDGPFLTRSDEKATQRCPQCGHQF
ncbi:MAG: hypothetical protein QNJ23_04895 [Woeseiaceae bacterium]|nr:hypothetical protein [Woeseiaceae bacterium]